MNQDQTTGYRTQTTPQLDAGYITLRIVPDRVLAKIELFLSNKRVFYDVDEHGNPVEQVKTMGEALANEQGISGLLNMVSSRVNEHTVQGNFTEERYGDYIYNTRMEFIKAVVVHRPYWGIKDSLIEPICDTIMGLIKPFMTRLIDNEERQGLNPTVRTNEHVVHNTNEQKGGILGRANI